MQNETFARIKGLQGADVVLQVELLLPSPPALLEDTGA